MQERDVVAEAMRARMEISEVKKVEVMEAIENLIVDSHNDKDVRREIKLLVRGAARSSKTGHALLVVGESHIGKSTLVNAILDEQKALAPIPDGEGDFYHPLFRIKAQSDCTMRILGEDMLSRLGYNVERKLDENAIFRLLRHRLRMMGVKVVFIDEFQHVLDAPTVKGVRHLTDTLKNMLQEDGWPVHLILCGLPEIVRVVDRDPKEQMEARTVVCHLQELNFETDADEVASIIETVVDTAGLRLALDPTDEFLERLFHGARNRLGLLFKMLHFAIEDALDEEVDEVSYDHWIKAYARLAKRGRNVFTDPEWHSIRRGVLRDGTLGPEDVAATPAKMKRRSK